MALNFGLPLVIIIDAVGSPITTAMALANSATTFVRALQAGDPLAALTALVDAPANAVNGFLNGEATLPLPLPPSLVHIPFMTVTSATAHVPIGGIRTPSAERYGHWRRRRDCEGSADRHRPRCRGVVYRSTHLRVLRPTSLTVL